MDHTRRRFLKTIAMGAALGLTDPTRLFAAPPPQTRSLVVIFLRGGWDALNVVVPYSDPLYYAYRPTIAIPAPPERKKPKKKKRRVKLGESKEAKRARVAEEAAERKREEKVVYDPADPRVLPISDEFGLHPALSALVPLYQQGLFAPILCVGSKNPTRSHFTQQDCMDYATLSARHHSGWLNRYLQATKERHDPKKLRAVAVQRLLPRSMRGRYPVLAMDSIEGADGPMNAFRDLYGWTEQRGTGVRKAEPGVMERDIRVDRPAGMPADLAMRETVERMGRKTIDRMRHFSSYLGRGGGSDVDYPQHGLGQSLRKTAQLIRAGSGLEVAAFDYGGWDHHRSEGGVDGAISKKLRILGDSLAAFMEDLGEQRKNVLTLVMSEFGRTARENGNAGTDHGRGGLMFALGGSISGGQVYGKWAGLERGFLADGRDLPVLVDYRNVLAEALVGHLGMPLSKTVNADFFPRFKPNLGTDALAFVQQA